MGPRSGIARLLRSRRLAIALIAILAVYVFLGTVVPQGALESPGVLDWRSRNPGAQSAAASLGLHRVYSSVPFLAIVVLLTAATAVCAWERTESALRVRRRMRPATDAQVARLKDHPASVVALAPRTGGEDALGTASRLLRRTGLRIRRAPTGLDATSGAWTAFGSPAFHWALVAVAVVLATGQATRAEGAIQLPIGVPVPDVGASYAHLAKGPLFGDRFSGLTLVASDLVYNLRVDGINRGPAPVITLLDGSTAVASGRVYPNNPLRYETLLVHMDEYGLAPLIGLEDEEGVTRATKVFFLEFTKETSSGTLAQDAEAARGASLPPVAFRVEMPADRDASGILGRVPFAPRVLIRVGSPGLGLSDAVPLEFGESIDLPGGGKARFIDVQNWVRITVANDWSVPYVYALGMFACVTLAVSLFAPARGARFLVVETKSGPALHVASWHSRGDPSFAERMRSIANQAAGAESADVTDTGGEA
jgi:hypothetical protein